MGLEYLVVLRYCFRFSVSHVRFTMYSRGPKLAIATLLFLIGIIILNFMKPNSIVKSWPAQYLPNFNSAVMSEEEWTTKSGQPSQLIDDDSVSHGPKRQKVLIILTQTRCGSSFTGEVFAATNNNMYIYEPLYPFGLKCDSFKEEKLKLLQRILGCDFTNLVETYRHGFKQSGWPDGASCRGDGFCFTGASVGLKKSYQKTCETMKPDKKNCRYPMRHDVLENVCDNSSMIITKITRVCTVEDLEDIYQHLKQMNKDTYVLHLVRDLRSIASSRLKLEGKSKIQQVKGEISESYCPRQKANIEYLRNVSEGGTKKSSIIEDGRYMRLRYEDIATNAIGKAREVFEFMDLTLPPEVASNVRNHLQPNVTMLTERVKKGGKDGRQVLKRFSSPFGTVRDPFKVVEQWRNLLPFDLVKSIQEECGDVMKTLGYKLFEGEEDMKEFSVVSY